MATLPSVTILKAPLTSASVSLTAPEKAQPFSDATTTDSRYTVSTQWYQGTSASGSIASGDALPGTQYTAKVTLTAKTENGESFANNFAVAGWDVVVSQDGKTATLTKTFEATEDKGTTTVEWKNNTPIEKTYNGSAQEAADSAANAVTVTGSNGERSFRYYTNSGCTALTSVAGSGADAAGGAPKNAGTYWVKVEVAEDDYNKVGVTATARQFTIAKANASCTAPTGITGLTYTGEPQALVNAGTPTGGDMVYSTDGVNYGTTIPTGTDAGSYTVWYKVKGDDNHNNTAADSVAVSIGKKAAPMDVAKTYTVYYLGGQQTVTPVVTDFALPAKCGTKSIIAVTEGTDASDIISVSGNTITVTPNDKPVDTTATANVTIRTDNYADITAVVTIKLVDKVQANVTIGGSETYSATKTYGNSSFTLTAGVGSGLTGDNWSWTSSDETVLKLTNKNSATVTVSVLKASQTPVTLTATYESTTHKGSATATITVKPKSVTISGLRAENKTYDGTANAAVTGTATLTGRVGNDEVTVSAGSAAFADKNVGTGKTVTFSGYSLTGADAGNYVLSGQPASVKANITAKELTVTVTSDATVTKEYDGDRTVDQTLTLTLSGIVGSDTVTASAGSKTYDTKAVGTGKTVTLSGITLDGADKGNYTVAKTATTNGAITAKSVTITGLGAADKVYDGKTNATVIGKAALDGKISGDTVAVNKGTATFADKNVGTGKNVTFSGYSLSGKDAGNYELSAQPADDTANITAEKLTITGVSATSRSYEKNNTAVDLTGGSLVGVVSGDDVSFTLGSGTIESAKAGSGKAVKTNITLTGTDAGNYTLTQPAVTVNITKAAAPEAPGVTYENCTTYKQDNGKITGVTADMEYQLSGASAWTKCTGNEITGLAPGDYEIRVAETANVLAGEAAKVTIAKHKCEFGTYTLTTDATCQKNGTETASCTGAGCKATNTRESAEHPMTAHKYKDGVCTVCGAVNPVGTTLSTDAIKSAEDVAALVSEGKIAVEEDKKAALVTAIQNGTLTTKNEVETADPEPAEEKKFEDQAAAVVSSDSTVKSAEVVDYLDISVALVKSDDDTKLGNITETDQPVTFQIKLADTLLADLEGKSVFVLRAHGSEITKLPATLSADGILTFSSDKFSTYAIVAYEPVSGGSHHGGSYNPGHTVTSDLGNVTRVTVDGKVVDSKYYTISGGNVVLSGEFMKTLTNGKHTVKLYNGSTAATGVITVTGNTVQAPRTGDAGAVLYGVMAISSVLGMGWVARKKRCEK